MGQSRRVTNTPIREVNRQDPQVPDWAAMQLEDTWPDALPLGRPNGIWRLLSLVFSRQRGRVRLPDNLPGVEMLPRYLLQEFHNLPNGNYSRRISRGYITGFDRSMLGYTHKARRWIAQQFAGADSVLDIGTCGGHTARVMKDSGITDVWGLDASPYLLKHAASDHPDIKFVHGLAEDLPFPAARFDGVSLCFVLHEIPPKYIRAALAAMHRVLKPGGVIAIAEPSERQLQAVRLHELLHPRGWLRLYFGALARFVHEPYLKAWHKLDKAELFKRAGFELEQAMVDTPINCYRVRKA